MDKFLENLMESKWFVRVLALVLTLLLYVTAFIDEEDLPNSSNNTHKETIEDVPVVLYYEEENFVVTGAPSVVNVIVEGNYSLAQSAKNLRDFTVYIDLSDAKIGAQRVELKVRDISDKLRVTIEPASVVVNVQEKVTEEFSVEAEFNRALLEEGYTAEQPIIEPNTVKITGGKDVIDQITYVKAIVEPGDKVNETFTQRAYISVLDKNLNKLNVTVEPDRVDVTIHVVTPKKTVPIVIKQEGSPKDGIYIKSIEPKIRDIVIFGKKSVLDKINEIEVPVDVSDIDSNEELSIPITLQDGLEGATPESLNVIITVDVEATKNVQGLPINVIGLDDSYALEFLNPENGQVNLALLGPSEILGKYTSEDFEASINVSNYSEGEHRVELMVDGPNDIKWEAELENVRVLITILDDSQ